MVASGLLKVSWFGLECGTTGPVVWKESDPVDDTGLWNWEADLGLVSCGLTNANVITKRITTSTS